MNEIRLFEEAGRAAENKNIARTIREAFLVVPILAGQEVTLDFANVEFATQSFVHALLSRLIRETRGAAIELIRFINCNDNVRAVIETVILYSQDGIPLEDEC
jgi:hypothetical protein